MPATTNPIPMPTPPIPLPQQHSSTVPHFNPQNPSTLVTYLSDYESLAESAQITPGK